jgi:uncharacterized membrane protein
LIIRKTKITVVLFAVLIFALLFETLYLKIFHSISLENLNKKKVSVSLIGLPDFALAQESFIRHRSLSSVYNIYSIDVALREYAMQTYTISNASIKEQK